MDRSQSRLDFLLNRYRYGQASEEERQELMLLLKETWDHTDPHQPSDHIDWTSMLESIKAEGRRNPLAEEPADLEAPVHPETPVRPEVPVRRLPLRPAAWYRIAAAVLLLAGGGIAVYTYQRMPVKQMAAHNVPAHPVAIVPGQNKAILTLSGGQQILLDSAGSDTVLTEGSDIIASAKGSIAYNAGSSSADTGAVYNTLSTPRGGQYRLTLPDGTKVWLNAASSIQYPTSFNGSSRIVTVSGESYFEVAPRANQPFMVKTGNTMVAVLGTSFNINAYADEPSIKTSLLEGSIKVSQGRTTAILTPGQQAKLYGDNSLEVTKLSNPASVIAWKNGYFSFEKADIPTVMRQLSRWYDFEVSYEGGSAPSDYFWGDLKRDASLSDIFAILGKSGIYFTVNGNKVLVLNKH